MYVASFAQNSALFVTAIEVKPAEEKPAEAMQPQFEQSGFPPNWHGEMWRSKSADTQVVVCAKMHSPGSCGGCLSRSAQSPARSWRWSVSGY